MVILARGLILKPDRLPAHSFLMSHPSRTLPASRGTKSTDHAARLTGLFRSQQPLRHRFRHLHYRPVSVAGREAHLFRAFFPVLQVL